MGSEIVTKIILGLATCALAIALAGTTAEAARPGSHRVGGHGPQGKGSHYVGGHKSTAVGRFMHRHL